MYKLFYDFIGDQQEKSNNRNSMEKHVKVKESEYK